MSCEHLVCASCANPVVEGRCPRCRNARADLHHHGVAITPQLIAVIALVLTLLVLVLRTAA